LDGGEAWLPAAEERITIALPGVKKLAGQGEGMT
jgi:hypothetical protein